MNSPLLHHDNSGQTSDSAASYRSGQQPPPTTTSIILPGPRMSDSLQQTPALRFNMPPGLERFHLFRFFPYDIRYKIWQSLIYTSGIHFLKFEKFEAPTATNSEESENGGNGGSEAVSLSSPGGAGSGGSAGLRGEQIKTTNLTAQLKPVYPTAAADMSYYITASKMLTQLSLVCEESADMVRRATQKPGGLVLDNARMITLAGSADIVCIDYPDMRSMYTRSMGKWSTKLDTAQLAKVRRLAVRYNPDWDEVRRPCRICGQVHSIPSKELPRRHLYEFVALFPNLETFHFVDHLTVKKPKGYVQEEEGCRDKNGRWLDPEIKRKLMMYATDRYPQEERFASGGRTYYDVDPKKCIINTSAFNILEWVQENYISYCRKYKKHKSPESVKFGVLGCEWDMEHPKYKKSHKAPAINRSSGPPRRARRRPDLPEAFRALRLTETERAYTVRSDLPVQFGSGNNAFPFTFTMKYR